MFYSSSSINLSTYVTALLYQRQRLWVSIRYLLCLLRRFIYECSIGITSMNSACSEQYLHRFYMSMIPSWNHLKVFILMWRWLHLIMYKTTATGYNAVYGIEKYETNTGVLLLGSCSRIFPWRRLKFKSFHDSRFLIPEWSAFLFNQGQSNHQHSLKNLFVELKLVQTQQRGSSLATSR